MNILKKIWDWIKYAWFKFEAFVAKVAPGLKTVIVSGLGMIGSAAATLQQYITGIPIDKFASDTQIAIVAGVLFTLAFWLRGIGDRVADRVVAAT